MISIYTQWVSANPIVSAMIQFGILGTLGEVIAFSIREKQVSIPCRWWQLGLKVVAWAILGLIIKVGFTGMKGFVTALIDHKLLPQVFRQGFLWAFSVSVFTNFLFGPQMMAFHRLEDNLIMNQRGYANIRRSWLTLIWFWIPAHTLTFMLPADLQIGLAALWSLALGILMVLMRPKQPIEKEHN